MKKAKRFRLTKAAKILIMVLIIALLGASCIIKIVDVEN